MHLCRPPVSVVRATWQIWWARARGTRYLSDLPNADFTALFLFLSFEIQYTLRYGAVDIDLQLRMKNKIVGKAPLHLIRLVASAPYGQATPTHTILFIYYMCIYMVLCYMSTLCTPSTQNTLQKNVLGRFIITSKQDGCCIYRCCCCCFASPCRVYL